MSGRRLGAVDTTRVSFVCLCKPLASAGPRLNAPFWNLCGSVVKYPEFFVGLSGTRITRITRKYTLGLK